MVGPFGLQSIRPKRCEIAKRRYGEGAVLLRARNRNLRRWHKNVGAGNSCEIKWPRKDHRGVDLISARFVKRYYIHHELSWIKREQTGAHSPSKNLLSVSDLHRREAKGHTINYINTYSYEILRFVKGVRGLGVRSRVPI
jgi:hypothetical protein